MRDLAPYLTGPLEAPQLTEADVPWLKLRLEAGGGVYVGPALAAMLKAKRPDFIEGVHYHINRPLPIG